MSILPGNGDSTVQSALTYPSFSASPPAIADISRDGRLDLITPGDTFGVQFARCVR